MKTRTIPHTKAAFTLIELMVVVSIIALLVSILLPGLARAREHAYQVKCAAHLNAIFMGVFYYIEDRNNGDGYLPQMSYQYMDEYPGGIWLAQIQPYVRIMRSKAGSRQGLLRCPAEEHPTHRYLTNPKRPISIGAQVAGDAVALKAAMDVEVAFSGVQGGLVRRPSNSAHIEPVSYSGACDTNQRVPWTRTGRYLDTPRKLADIDRPYCYPLLTEVPPDNTRKGCWRFYEVLDRFEAEAKPATVRHFGGTSTRNNGTNWLFADGHVQWHSAFHAKIHLVCCFDLGIPDSAVAETIIRRDDIVTHCDGAR